MKSFFIEPKVCMDAIDEEYMVPPTEPEGTAGFQAIVEEDGVESIGVVA